MNILNPDGSEPYQTGEAGTVEQSINGGGYSRVYNEGASSYAYGTTFNYRNFTPGTGRHLSSVSGVSPANTTGPWSLTLNAGTTVEFKTAWNTYTITIRRGTGIADITSPAWGWTGNYKTGTATYGNSFTINVSCSTGYHWGSWSGTYNTTTQSYTFTVNKNVDVTANAIANTYTVAYNGNGNTGGSTASSSHTYDSAKALTANGFTRTGYTFAGWNTKADGTGTGYSNQQSVTNLTSTNGGTVTLYAQWTINKYYFDLNGSLDGTHQGGLSPMGTANVTINGSVVATGTTDHYIQYNHGTTWKVDNIKTNAGYTYTGNASYSGTINGANASAVLPYTTNSYTVAYNANGGSSTPTTQTAKYNTAVTLASAISRANSDSNVIITITYNANGGSSAPSASTGTAVNTTPYTFNKWALNSASGTQYVAGASYTIPAANSTMYATWTTGTTTRKSNPSITLSPTKPTRSGYDFKGWSTSNTATTASYNAGTAYTFSANTTLYAVWELAQANLYTKKDGAWVKGPAYVKVDGAWKVAKQVYTKVNGAWVLNGGASKITFTIKGTTYEADAGMTWTQWVASSYNTLGATINSSLNRITWESNGTHSLLNTTHPDFTAPGDVIISGHAYGVFTEK
jgi:uncharacterized repeat protein (TIGR02543 family)